MTLEKILYTAKAHTTGGREGGASHTDDGRLDVKLSPPGGPGAGTNPEQLFAAGWSSASRLASTSVCRAWTARLLRLSWKPRTRCAHTPTRHAATSTSRSQWSDPTRKQQGE